MDLSPNQLGRLGETAVSLELQKKSFDVINLNDSIKNFPGADLLCVSSKSGKHTFIQVKTGSTNNIQCGLVSTTGGIIDNLKSKVTCPWVFVHVEQHLDDISFEFYVLTKDETLELIDKSNHWYTKEWTRSLKCDVHVGVDVKWLKGEGSKESKGLHPAFESTLRESALNRWDKLDL